MAYKLSDRAKEWTTYAGVAIAALSAVLPQIVPEHGWAEAWQAAQMLLGAALIFMPQTAGTTAVENEGLTLLRALSDHLPAQYASAMQPFITVLTTALVQKSAQPVPQQPLPAADITAQSQAQQPSA